MNQPSAPNPHDQASPVVVTLSGHGLARLGLCAAALALIVLPALALSGSGGAGSSTLVDQQLDGIVRAGSAAPTTDPVTIPAANMPLPLSPAAGLGIQPTASLTVLGPRGTAAPIAQSAFLPGSSRGIPLTVLAAYHHAADLLAARDPHCGLPWWVLAGIGRIESGHAAGGHVDSNGTTIGRIVGPRLDGSTPGTGIVLDTDHGVLDGDPLFDRAVGPMQFLPSTWAAVASDGNGDGRMDPNNVYDAALGAARYLCENGASLATEAGLTAAVMRYNHSAAYVAEVLSWGNAYRDGVTPVADGAGPIPTATHDAAASGVGPAKARHAAGPTTPGLNRRLATRPPTTSPPSSNAGPAPSPVATATASPGSSSTTSTPTSASASPSCTPTATPPTSTPTTAPTPASTSSSPTTASSPTTSTTSASSPPTSGPPPSC